jgi:hypothetical protein
VELVVVVGTVVLELSITVETAVKLETAGV